MTRVAFPVSLDPVDSIGRGQAGNAATESTCPEDVTVVRHDRVGLGVKALLSPALEQEPPDELGYAEIASLARREDAQHIVVVIATGRA